MFKKMKLGTKIGIGFGVMLLIATVLGVVAWSGVSAIAKNVNLSNLGTLAVAKSDECGKYRRDFTLQNKFCIGGDFERDRQRFRHALRAART